MIDYPKSFVEDQINADFINYYVLITGGGSRITIDGISGERTSGEKHISWGLHNCSFSYSAGGENIPLGAVPLQSGSMELVLLDNTYANYDWRIAVVNLYASNSYFADDILISCFRVTNIKRDDQRLILTLENKFQSRSKLRHLIDDKMPLENLSSDYTLINVYKKINRDLATFSELKLDNTCLNASLHISKIGDMSYRQQLSDIAQLAGAGMMLKTAYTTADSGFHFAPVKLSADYDYYSDTELINGKSISNSGLIFDNIGTSVTGYISIDFSKTYIFDLGNVNSQWSNIRFAVYDANKNLIASDPISDFETAPGKGYIIFSEYYDPPSSNGFVRFTVLTENVNKVYLHTVDHILKNWVSVQVDLAVTPTAIRYNVGGNDDTRYTNIINYTALNPSAPSVTQNHLYIVNTLSSFNSIPSKERDLYAIVNASNVVERVVLNPSEVPITWQGNNRYLLLAHGNEAQWLKYFIYEGDQIRYDQSTSTLTVNKVADSQEYVIDITDNQTLKSLSVASGTEAVSNIAKLIVGHSFYPFSGVHLNLPFVEPFDTLGIVDREGNVYFSFATDITFAPYGATQISNNAKLGTID